MIKIINKEDITPIKREAILSRLTFNNSTNIYWGYFINDNIVAFCGLMLKKNKAILKNGFTLKHYRNQGIYSKLNKARFDYIKTLNISIIESNVTDKSINYHLKNGAIIIKEYKCCKTIQYNKIWEEQQ